MILNPTITAVSKKKAKRKLEPLSKIVSNYFKNLKF